MARRHSKLSFAFFLLLAGLVVSVIPSDSGATSAASVNNDEAFKGMYVETIKAWRRGDGQTRYAYKIKNGSSFDFQDSDDRVRIIHQMRTPDGWKAAGFTSVNSLKSGATYDRENLPFNGENADRFRVYLEYQGVRRGARTVSLQNGEPAEYQDATILEGREVMNATTLEGLSAKLDDAGNGTFSVTIRNGSSKAFDPEMGEFSLNKSQLVHANYEDWKPSGSDMYDQLDAHGAITIVDKPYYDLGGTEFRVSLSYDKGGYATATVPVQGAALRDQRATQIAAGLSIASLEAWRDENGQGWFNLNIKNSKPFPMTPAMGSLTVQTEALKNGHWSPAGGFKVTKVGAGTTYLKNEKFIWSGSSSMRVTITFTNLKHEDTQCDVATAPVGSSPPKSASDIRRRPGKKLKGKAKVPTKLPNNPTSPKMPRPGH